MSLLVGSNVCVTPVQNGQHHTITRRMSSPGLTSEAQLRYILQWFGEFSELQREDFVPILAAAQSGRPDHLADVLAKLTCQDKPVSLFQCRIKLFNEWYPTWNQDERERLVKGVTDMDSDFGVKLHEALDLGPKQNGEVNGTSEALSPGDEEEAHIGEPEDDTAPTEDAAEEAPEAPAVQSQDNIPVQIAAAS